MALEVCVDSVSSALNASRGGAKRLELCSALALGGLTPSLGMFEVIRELLPRFPIFIMIRPKPGEDYVYDHQELLMMLKDIQIFKQSKADGFVFGCLTSDKEIDEEACKMLLKAAGELPCTFHRAFDVVKNPEISLSTLVKIGFSRILTSGQAKDAYVGRNLIRKLVEKVKEMRSTTVIVAGGGLDPDNLKEVLETGVKEYHGSARAKASMSKTVYVTDECIVRKMVSIGEAANLQSDFTIMTPSKIDTNFS